MFWKKKSSQPTVEYDPSVQRAVLKCSICNGEQVAGFKDMKTGKFTDVMLVKNDNDLNAFMQMYGLSSISREY